jgi:hypothetical protein
MRYQDLRHGRNVWDYYFEQPFNFTKEEVEGAEKIKNVWFEGNLNIPSRLTPEIIKKCGEIISKYIKLKNHVQVKIDTFIAANIMPGDRVLAVHKRGTDHINDAPLLPIDVYFSHIDKHIENYDKLLLCTDEEYTVDIFSERYKQKLITYDSIRSKEKNNIGVHQSIGLSNPYKMGEDVVIETYLMSRSDFLIKTISNVSNSVLMINPAIKYVEIDQHILYN